MIERDSPAELGRERARRRLTCWTKPSFFTAHVDEQIVDHVESQVGAASLVESFRRVRRQLNMPLGSLFPTGSSLA